ncbi:MAG: LLM class F420-dependent oxidoreductase, partial [Gammaproteobacteria bacterium]
SSARPEAVARKCEDLGYESLLFPEHPIVPVTHKSLYVGSSDGVVPDPLSYVIDPFVGLGIASAVTNKIKLGTGICLVPERDPIVCAKEVATIDNLSGGRFLFGIGAGWLREELEIMGVEFKQRWAVTIDYVRAMKELWTKPESSYDGEFVKFPPVRSYPKPAQKPHPPIIVGAGGAGRAERGNDRAIAVTVAIGDEWGPSAITPEQLKPELEKLQKACEQAGRDFREIRVSVFGPIPGDDAHRAIREYEKAGVDRVVLFPPTLAPDKYAGELEDLASEWM